MKQLSGSLPEQYVILYYVCLPAQAAYFVVGEPVCDLEIPSWALKTLVRVIYWKKSGWSPMYRLSGPLPEQNVNFLR